MVQHGWEEACFASFVFGLSRFTTMRRSDMHLGNAQPEFLRDESRSVALMT
jgi:hypothetical protein